MQFRREYEYGNVEHTYKGQRACDRNHRIVIRRDGQKCKYHSTYPTISNYLGCAL